MPCSVSAPEWRKALIVGIPPAVAMAPAGLRVVELESIENSAVAGESVSASPYCACRTEKGQAGLNPQASCPFLSD